MDHIDAHGGGESGPALSGRRRFVRWLIGGFLSLWGFAGAGVVVSFLRPPERRSSPQRILSGGSFSSLAVGDARLVRHGSQPLFVVRVSNDDVTSLSAVCTHRQCVLNWSKERKAFECPCHAGIFDIAGQVVSGLPQSRLKEYPTLVRGDEILIHLG